jgi:hypothetical protein
VRRRCGLDWSCSGPSGGLIWTQKWPFAYHKRRIISWSVLQQVVHIVTIRLWRNNQDLAIQKHRTSSWKGHVTRSLKRLCFLRSLQLTVMLPAAPIALLNSLCCYDYSNPAISKAVGSTAMAEVPLESGTLSTCMFLISGISITRTLCAEATTHSQGVRADSKS